MMKNLRSGGPLAQILDRLLERSAEETPPGFRELVYLAGLDPSEDFVGASLREVDFRDDDLRGFNFSGADLSGADFRRANVTGVRFDGATLIGAIGFPSGGSANTSAKRRAVSFGLLIEDVAFPSGQSLTARKHMDAEIGLLVACIEEGSRRAGMSANVVVTRFSEGFLLAKTLATMKEEFKVVVVLDFKLYQPANRKRFFRALRHKLRQCSDLIDKGKVLPVAIIRSYKGEEDRNITVENSNTAGKWFLLPFTLAKGGVVNDTGASENLTCGIAELLSRAA